MFKVKTLNEISQVYRQVLPAAEYAVSRDELKPDAIIVRSADMHATTFEDNLLAVGRAGAGYNNIPVAELGKKGVVVFNTPGANANAVKELVIAGLLLASRNVAGGIAWCGTLKGRGAEVAALVEKGKNQFVGPELRGKTLGVIGLGGVGGLVANAAVTLDMKVLGYDPFISVDNAWRLSRAIAHVTSEDDLLAQSDYVSLHVPLMDSTRGTFNAEKFARMKQGAALLNFARGELAVPADIIAALAAGQLRSYVTDFPCDELIGAPGVVTIPHLGASTPESEDNCVYMVGRQIDRYLKDGTVKNSVNYPDCELSPGFKHRVAVMHANVPNMVGSITSTIASFAINIDNMVNKSRGAFAYTALDLDEPAPEAAIARLASLGDVYRVRSL